MRHFINDKYNPTIGDDKMTYVVISGVVLVILGIILTGVGILNQATSGLSTAFVVGGVLAVIVGILMCWKSLSGAGRSFHGGK